MNINKWITLSTREKEVAVAIVKRGLLNKQIAFELGIVEKTVKVHRGRAMAKLGVKGVVAFIRAVDAAMLEGDGE